MAFRVPRFNLKCIVYGDTGAYIRGWSVCQIRGPTSHVDSQTGSEDSGMVQILFPKGSDVRDFTLANPQGQLNDIIQLGGQGRVLYLVRFVADKGAGFTNEYRIAECVELTGTINQEVGLPTVDPDIVQPPGVAALPIKLPVPWRTI